MRGLILDKLRTTNFGSTAVWIGDDLRGMPPEDFKSLVEFLTSFRNLGRFSITSHSDPYPVVYAFRYHQRYKV